MPPLPSSSPLSPEALETLALDYAARFSTSAAKLEAYLLRKLRQRGWAGAGEDQDGGGGAPMHAWPYVAALVERCVAAGYVDDAAFARVRAEGLLRRGYGARRIAEALNGAGIDEDLRGVALPDDAAARRAAFTMACKRRFGPWGAALPDSARAQKQVAALCRAGHPLGFARALVHAGSVEEAEAWRDEAHG